MSNDWPKYLLSNIWWYMTLVAIPCFDLFVGTMMVPIEMYCIMFQICPLPLRLPAHYKSWLWCFSRLLTTFLSTEYYLPFSVVSILKHHRLYLLIQNKILLCDITSIVNQGMLPDQICMSTKTSSLVNCTMLAILLSDSHAHLFP